MNISMNTDTNNIEFQIYDWIEDTYIENEDSDSENNNNLGKYIIHLFGRCNDGKSVYARVINYTPYFYMLLPDNIQNYPTYKIEQVKKKIDRWLKENKQIYYKYKSTLEEIQIIKHKKADGFNNDKEFYFLRLVFNNIDGMKSYRRVLENNDVCIDNDIYNHRFKLYEANVPPMLRCFHIKNISGCSWVKVSNYNLIDNSDEKISYCDLEIIIDWRYLNPIKKDNNAPFRICSFDIECYSESGNFPIAKNKGDKIIQIGATYTYLGTSQPYRQYIACLHETKILDNTTNIIVESFNNEKELILGFVNEIINNDCDILTGYNIFNFDENYIYEKCCSILNIKDEILYISKLKNYKCKFEEKKLSSLGDNVLKYINTPGRVHIDLMKDIQKTENLSCYKLDYVASQFIRGKILNYKILEGNNVELTCSSINDIYKNDYIHIEVIKGFISDDVGVKYLVLDINNENGENIIIVKSDDFLINEINSLNLDGTLNWSQAKDDVAVKDIFRLFKGSDTDRGIVAKYCIKDCKLVNLLINKLEIVTKNLEMANVCFVPLSYLFVRGQGIKSYSLCSREFRKQKYLFPVIKLNKLYTCSSCEHVFYNLFQCPNCNSKKRIEMEMENMKYEGAIVFDPVPKVEYEALAVKDYMSLYPCSIMQKNMSHETIVENPEYDNLPNVNYHNAQFKENDGSIKYCRYAQINNKLGVIPTILNDLLTERKNIKKLMKLEKDPFKYKILDAKQGAIKTTANSLYGQLGAPTSPVFKREIAACTTSTGREMLILAKKFDEEILPSIINGFKYFYKNSEDKNLEDNKIKIDKLNNLTLKLNNLDSNKKIILEIKDYIDTINDLILQPIIRYGDTDSTFCCYRFREDCTLVGKTKSLYIWKDIVKFARDLILPFFSNNEQEIFNKLFDEYYSDEKITDLSIPQIDFIKLNDNRGINIPDINGSLLPIEERMRIFINEYMTESYLPWLWTLSDLVDKDHTFIFNIKLTKWAEYLLSKIGLSIENLYENRKNLLMNPIIKFMEKIFPNNVYTIPNDENILEFADLIISTCTPTLPKDKIYLFSLCKTLLEKTIKDKWIYSNSRCELRKIIIDFLKIITTDEINFRIKNNQIISNNFINYIIKIKELKTNENLIDILEKNPPDNININIDKAKEHVKFFEEKYSKNNGAKTIHQIIEIFIEKDLELSFNYDQKDHYDKVIEFIKRNVLKYWIQPRIDFIDDKIVYKIDIFKGGKPITDSRSLDYTIKMGKLSSDLIKSIIPSPHDNEYEKTYWGFLLLAKKKYCGNKYEFDINKFKLDFMGIVLKRRDNAPIVKEICAGILDYLINKKDPDGAKKYTIDCMDKMFKGLYNIKYFLLSKTIKSKTSYKNWERISHVYLADKIEKRTPGEEPQSGDRIEYAFVKIPKTNDKVLQGELIETPQYIKENNLELDYLYYLTNQIMNPALQFLELADKNAKSIFTDFINKYSSQPINKKKPVVKKIINYYLELQKMSKALTKKLVLLETSFKKTSNYINDIKIKLN
jgi:DNA polymerase elongation subunit (family B)